MVFWISWSNETRKVCLGQGYFNCPSCNRRQPGELHQGVRRRYLYGFIPLSGGDPVGPEFYHCSRCQGEFEADGRYGYDFGEDAVARTWRCFKCNGEVPYQQFDCPHCGYRLDVGGDR